MRSGGFIEGRKTEVERGTDTMQTFDRGTSKRTGVSASVSVGPFFRFGKSMRLLVGAV
jgi:hypothetical protein